MQGDRLEPCSHVEELLKKKDVLLSFSQLRPVLFNLALSGLGRVFLIQDLYASI
jgi:hypothetical protein